MSLIDQIDLRSGRYDIQVVEMLKKTKQPIALWGAGVYAKVVKNHLAKYQLSVEKVIVDDQYYKDGMFFEGIEVVCPSTLQKKDEQYFILIGIMPSDSRIQAIKERILKYSFCNGVDCLDLIREMIGLPCIDETFFCANKETLEQTYHFLNDELSKQIFVAFLNQNITRNICYLDQCFTTDQYFPSCLSFIKDEVFVDCGAYYGDTVTAFIEEMDKQSVDYKQIIAFEPDEINYKALTSQYGDNNRCLLLKKGVYFKQDSLCFSTGNNALSNICESGKSIIEVDSIDHVMKGDKVTYIKMDIEGSEMAALEGAKETIRTYKPKLAICIYHKREDLIQIPQYIKKLVPEYKFYLRAHTSSAIDVVLYATV